MDFSAKLLLTLCLVLIFQSPLLTNARVHSLHRLLGGTPDMIGQICKQTKPEDISHCNNILRSDPKIFNAKNYFKISEAILELAINKATKVQIYFQGLLKTKDSPAIEQCANSDYVQTIGSFKSALGELKVDPLSANYDAKVAGDGPQACESALVAAKIVNPTASALNHEIYLLGYVAYLATNNLI